MRVIGGEARGRKLFTPKDDNIRPTADRFRETLFNIIGPDILGAAFLDLFGGTGAVGIEALSRGAGFAAFADTSADALELIRKNIGLARVGEKSLVLAMDCLEALRVLWKKGLRFDYIFIDPPYHQNLSLACLEKIQDFDLLKRGGVIIAERASDEFDPELEGFEVYRLKEFANTAFSFMRAVI